MIRQLLQKIPGGENVAVFLGTSLLVGLCAVPVFRKDTKKGHGLFDHDKPQMMVDSEDKLRKEYIEAKKQLN